MAVNFASLIVEMWLLAALVLTLHRITDRYGLAPLIMMLGGIIGILRFASSIGVYITVTDDLRFTVASNVFIPIVIMIILVMYVANGTVAARIGIFSIIGVEILTLLVVSSLSRHLDLESGGSFAALAADSPIFDVTLRDVFASGTAFIIDLYAVGILIQVCVNYAPRLSQWLSIGLTLLMVLILNSLIFWSLSVESMVQLIDFLPGSILGNIISAIILFPMVAYYLVRVAPKMPNYVGLTQRPTFDLLFGSFGQIEQELMQSRTALAHTAAQYRELTANINQGFWLFDPTIDKVTYVSPAYEEIWDLSFEIAHQNPTNFLKMIHPDDREKIAALLPEQKTGNYDEMFRVVHDDGTVRWVRDRAFVIYDDEGKAYRLAGITEDITERKRAEKEIRYLTDFHILITHLSAEFINVPSDKLGDAIRRALQAIGEFVEADHSYIGLISEDQTQYTEVLEWTRGHFSPTAPYREYIPTSTYPWMWEQLQRHEPVPIVCVADLSHEAVRYKQVLEQNGIRSKIAIPLVDRNRLLGYVGFDVVREEREWSEDVISLLQIAGQIFSNAIQRKRAEEHLNYVSDFRKLIATLAIDFITIPSEEIDNRIQEVMQLIGEFVDADRVFIGLFEDDLEVFSVVNEWCAPNIDPFSAHFQNRPSHQYPMTFERLKNFDTILVPHVSDLPADAPIKTELMAGIQSMIMIPLVAAGGLIGLMGLHKLSSVKEWTEDTATLLKIVGEIYVNGVERKQSEHTLLENQRLQLELENEKALSEFRVQFISMVSHEFRTPLSVIHTASSILESHSEQLKAEQRQSYFTRIVDQVDFLSDMLDNVLLTMRAEAGHLEFKPQPLDYDDFCADIVEKLRLTLLDNQSLTFEHEGDLKDLPGDKTLLEHVVTNLLSNAIKYSPDGGQIRLDVQHKSDEVIMAFKDEGIGMSEEDQAKLFQPYFRAKNVGRIKGTGLGLKITSDCVKLHGGRIEVESKLEVGTTFRVFIPIGA